MSRFFTRERFGRPQFVAGLLLLVFLAQCVWLVDRKAHNHGLERDEIGRAVKGLQLWSGERAGYTGYFPASSASEGQPGEPPAVDVNHSNLWYLISAAPLLLEPPSAFRTFPQTVFLLALPYLLFGVLLGASLWYVARRLYGNAGGYIALTLYCFSPGIIQACALWHAQPESGAAWGAFGSVFTAIAVAHTLYAPREVVLWNWRRIGLLGLSFALAVGSQYSLIVVVPIALAFMLYLAPARRASATAIWAAACLVGVTLLFAAYFFHPQSFWESMRHASFSGLTWRAVSMGGAYRQLVAHLRDICPALALALPAGLIAFASWQRARYFGNTAPLLVATLFLIFGLATPHYQGFGFQLLAVPFLFVFVAGILADLLETRQRALVLGCICGLLGASALWNLVQLAQAG